MNYITPLGKVYIGDFNGVPVFIERKRLERALKRGRAVTFRIKGSKGRRP